MISCSCNAPIIRSRRSVRLCKFIMNTCMWSNIAVNVIAYFWQQREIFSTEVEREPFLQMPSSHHSLLTSSKPSLSGCLLGTRMYLEGITGGFRTTRWEGRWMQKWYKIIYRNPCWKLSWVEAAERRITTSSQWKKKEMNAKGKPSLWMQATHR